MTALLETPSRKIDRGPAPRVTPASRNGLQLQRDDVRAIARRGLLLIALYALGLIAYLLGGSHLVHARAQDALQRRFESELANAIAPVNQPVPLGAPVAAIDIPAIGMSEIVVEGSTSTQLMRGPGHLRATTLPGQPGTSIVLCRRSAFGGPCADLNLLAANDSLSVTNGQGTVEYRVTETGVFAANDARAFAGRGNALVLITMDNELFGTQRLVVVAEPLTQQQRGSRSPSGPLRAEDLGLAGDRDAAALVLVWFELLAIIAIGAVVLFRRWVRGPAYLVAVPPLLAATWLSYEHVTRLLPAML